ncbi:MAG: HigA family addiction module antitoxin [Bacteroidota bacterium]|nr:HigA family addiction module antitoxin [Bacteroidota bacterium]
MPPTTTMTTPININKLTPAIAIHPGEMLLDELNTRGIKQKDFAALIGMANTQLNEVIKGKRNITADFALLIGKALKMDALLWMNLQMNYDLNLAKINDKNKAKLEAIGTWQMVETMIPAAYFKKQGIISGDIANDLLRIKDIYQINYFDELPQKNSELSHYRKSEKLSVDKINLAGWTHLVHYKASSIRVAEFDSRSKDSLIAKLKAVLVKNKNTVIEAARVLAEYGIKLQVLPHPEKCAVDGISFWSNGNPAIGLSVRHQRIDNFAFTLLHELGHVYLHLTSDNEAQFIDMENNVVNDKEKEADEFATEHLIDKANWKQFYIDHSDPNDDDFIAFAKRIQVHSAIVLGRYCHQIKKFNLRTKIDKGLR